MTALPERLVLFDGECAVCDATVQFLLDRDPDGVLHYAPLQGETAAGIVARHPWLADLDTLVLIENAGADERVRVHSHAIFHMLRALGGPWSAVSWLRMVPQPLTDLGYRTFAALRYRLFGRLEECRIPRPEEVGRFHP